MNAHFNDIDSKLVTLLRQISLSMFNKSFFGIFHGSISARLTAEQFAINSKKAVFDNLNQHNIIPLNIQKDYRWNEASVDASIHSAIYQAYNNAKFIVYAMPPYSVSCSIEFDTIKPLDFFGKRILGEEIKVWDTQDYESWYERASQEIAQNIDRYNKHFLLIKGYGIYAFDRDIYALAKKIAVIENTCKIIHFNADLKNHRGQIK